MLQEDRQAASAAWQSQDSPLSTIPLPQTARIESAGLTAVCRQVDGCLVDALMPARSAGPAHAGISVGLLPPAFASVMQPLLSAQEQANSDITLPVRRPRFVRRAAATANLISSSLALDPSLFASDTID